MNAPDQAPDPATRPGTANGAAGVRMRGVTKAFGSNVVLRDLDLDVDPGERVVIIGPSGSGKTTILRVIMTLERIDSGTIEVGDRHLYHEPHGDGLKAARERYIRSVRSDIGMVFQHFNLFPHMTAMENVLLAPRRVLSETSQTLRPRAEELFARFGLATHQDKYPDQLSGGQQQRVAVIRALAMRPEMMLFDEITSALDPELVGEVLDVLRQLRTEGMTMILATHEMGFARELADRVCFMDGGVIVEQGPPDELFSAPKVARTQEFLRSILPR